MKRVFFLISALIVSLLLTVIAYCETPYLDLTDESEVNVSTIFNLEEVEDMYVRVEYRGACPSVSIIKPIGLPCSIQEASPQYEEGCITYLIPSATTGQWYIHTATEDADRLSVSFGNIEDLEPVTIKAEVLIFIGIIGGILIFSIYYCLVGLMKNDHISRYHTTDSED